MSSTSGNDTNLETRVDSRIPPVDLAVRTDPGRDPDKQVNEDAHVHAETALGLLAVVCDGMGGHAGGKEASNLAIATIVEIVQNAPYGSVAKTVLRHAIEEANARIWSMPTAEPGLRPGSTVVAMLVHENGAEIAHVGDSRIYLVHAGAISQVTRDHSMVQEMVDRNLIKAEDAAKHPDANKILRALGIARDVEVDVRAEAIAYAAGDVFVLCSDGLSDLASPSEILDIAGSRPVAQAAGQLVDLANARGGHDNITAMVVMTKSTAARDPAAIVKTVQLTAHDPPLDPNGPNATVLAAPVGAGREIPPTLVSPVIPSPHGHPQGVPPMAAPHVPPATPSGGNVAIPPAPQSAGHRRSAIPAVLGILLAIAGLGILAGGIWVWLRPQHRNVGIVDDTRDAAAVGLADAGDDDAGEPEIVAAPPLDPSSKPDGGRHHHHRDASAHPHDAGYASDPTAVPVPTPTAPPLAPPSPGAEPPVCAKARDAKARGLSPAVVQALESQCRNSGGRP